MTSKKILVDFFYDTISPYSYIGFENIIKCNKLWGNMELKLQPVLIGGVMSITKNQPPGVHPPKASYMRKDLKRKSKFFGLEYNEPKDLPGVLFTNSTLKPQRLLTVVSKETPEKLEDVSREFFQRIWVKDQNVSANESMVQACMDAKVDENQAKDWLSRISQDETKEALKATTAEAIEYGAFGMPIYVAHLENEKAMFFGCDQLYLLAKCLDTKWDPNT